MDLRLISRSLALKGRCITIKKCIDYFVIVAINYILYTFKYKIQLFQSILNSIEFE